MDGPMIQAVGVHKRFGVLHVLKGLSFDIPRGQVVALIGPSGSGKSTLLRCINHLEGVSEGRLYVDGRLLGYREKDGRLVPESDRAIAQQRAEIGMVFQSFNLFPHMTALGNVTCAPVRVRKTSRAQAQQEGRALLERVALPTRPRPTLHNCQVDNNSELRLRGPWPCIQN